MPKGSHEPCVKSSWHLRASNSENKHRCLSVSGESRCMLGGGVPLPSDGLQFGPSEEDTDVPRPTQLPK